jgi:membrane protein DedA with SNARE-associated domain
MAAPMSPITDITNAVLGAPAWLVYLIVGALVFAEDALFVGFVLPGETAAVLGGVAASRGQVELPVMIAVVVLAAILGDSVGYEVGHRYGARILQLRFLARHHRRLADAQDLLARRGGGAVFLGRFVAFFRAVMPALAGTSHMPYRRFLPFNAVGGLVWGTGFVLLGYVAGNSYAQLEKSVGRALALVVLGIVLVGLIVWRVRKGKRERQALEADVDTPGSQVEPDGDGSPTRG